MSLQAYQVCGHCNQLLSDKALKEHYRLYFDDEKEVWIKFSEEDKCGGSLVSSPLGFSPPGSAVGSVEEHLSQSSDEQPFEDCDMDLAECSGVLTASDMEYWDESDSAIDEDFTQKESAEPPTPNQGWASQESQDEGLSKDERSLIWWVVAFTCVFETLHTLSSRAVAWLLHFLSSLFFFLGQYSNEIANIARAFPSTLHQRSNYMNEKLSPPSLHQYIVCRACLSLHDYNECIEKRGSQILVKSCPQCQLHNKTVPLLRQVIAGSGNKKYYPYLVYPYVSLVSSLQSLFLRPDFYSLCEEWRQRPKDLQSHLSDVYDGRLWTDFMQFDGQAFLMTKNSIGFMLNIDWFQPYKHRIYSIGVIYLAIMNLPRAIRFKRENIIIVGLLPGPKEPSKNINTYLTPLVSELLLLWEGVSLRTYNAGDQCFRCALLCIGCDLPAGRKTCGFLSHAANLGCTRCYCNFGTGIFGKMDYSGFNRDSWTFRSNKKHREDVKATLACTSKTVRERKESEMGCRYSCLLQLPYFDAIRMLIIDPMHNLYLGTAKYIFNSVWMKKDMITPTSIKKINDKILSWVIPPEVRFARLPANMEHSSSFTAEQWMVWVNYYSLNCLYGILPSDHLECWRHFVLASRLLCKQQLSKDEIRVADALLLRFCRRFETLYGPQAVTPNIHLHSHLTECIKDYGPMSTFWLYSFERFNGILGDEPTNNRSIEVQLISRFVKDNCHLQLLSSISSASNGPADILSHAVIQHAFGFTSTRHLDATCHSTSSSETDFLPATKHTISSFSASEMDILSNVYHTVYPAMFTKYSCVNLPQSFRKMITATIKGQKIKSGQYVWAKYITEFPCASSLPSLRTVFTDPNVRPAKIHYFFVHTSQVNSSELISHSFAYVVWPMQHPLHSSIGKPYEVWCSSLNENFTANCIIPTQNILSLLLTAQQTYEDENVLVTVPLV